LKDSDKADTNFVSADEGAESQAAALANFKSTMKIRDVEKAAKQLLRRPYNKCAPVIIEDVANELVIMDSCPGYLRVLQKLGPDNFNYLYIMVFRLVLFWFHLRG
jgi:hypothetical protein